MNGVKCGRPSPTHLLQRWWVLVMVVLLGLPGGLLAEDDTPQGKGRAPTTSRELRPPAERPRVVRTQVGEPEGEPGREPAGESRSWDTKAKQQGPQQVEVRLMVIQATNSKTGYDPRVEKYRPQLAFLSYKGFDLLMEEKISLKLGETKTVGLFEGKTVEATLVSATDSRVNLRLRLLKADASKGATLDTTVTVPRKGTFFVGGPKHKEGVLILPVTAWY